MLFWLLVYTLLVVKRTSHELSRVLPNSYLFFFFFFFWFIFSVIIIHHCVEICFFANGATKKEIGRAKEYIVKQLGLETGQSVEMGTIHAGDFMVSSS